MTQPIEFPSMRERQLSKGSSPETHPGFPGWEIHLCNRFNGDGWIREDKGQDSVLIFSLVTAEGRKWTLGYDKITGRCVSRGLSRKIEQVADETIMELQD